MSVALRGNLKDFGIAEVFQLIGQQRKTGVLEITCDGVTVQLRFDEGSVVSASPRAGQEHAALGDLMVRCGLLTLERLAAFQEESEASATPLPTLLLSSGELSPADVETMETLLTHETIFRILRWSGGSFDFTAQPVAHDRPSGSLLGAEQILMDGLRMVDEWRTFLAHVPSEDTVFRHAGPFEVHRSRCGGEARHRLEAAERVFLLVDGRLTVRRVIDLSRLGTFEATRLLAELHRSGVVEKVDPGLVRRVRDAGTLPRPDRQQVRAWIAGAIALALLAGLSLQLRQGGLAAATDVAGFPLLDSPFETVAARAEQKRLRAGLHAFRWARAQWPTSLNELASSEWAPPAADSLAPVPGESYYYLRRDDDVVLLTPERHAR